MEKVNKHNSTITKGTRTKVAFAKDQKNVEKSAKELVKLAKEAKPMKDAFAEGQARGPAEEVGRLHGRIHQDVREARRRDGEVRCGVCRCQERLHGRQEGLRRLPRRFPQG